MVDLWAPPYYGTIYSLTRACPECGTGAVRKGPLVLARFPLRKTAKVVATDNGEVMVSNDLVPFLQDTGYRRLGEVVDWKEGGRLPVKSLDCEDVLPSFSDLTTGIALEGQCTRCHRDGHFDDLRRPLKIIYSGVHSSMLSHHVLCTYEHFGNGALREPFEDSVFAHPLRIVSESVREVLMLHGGQGLEFLEVEFR